MRHFRTILLLSAVAVVPACGGAPTGGAGAPALPASKDWTWISGSDGLDVPGVYGTKGTAAAANAPGARIQHVSWIDASNNFWLFGGAAGVAGHFNDLWKFDGSQWTWVSGSSGFGASGVYGAKGSPAAANTPGARVGSVAWSAGNALWLFGGIGYDASGNSGRLNDLWKFDGAQWTWVAGSSAVNPKGVYGTKGTPAAANTPGGRWMASGSIDAAGKLWLFGGEFGIDSAGVTGTLNDLWTFDGGQWTWVSGSHTVNSSGSYGTKGTAAAGNVPGARSQGVSWIDAAGRFWTHGGFGCTSTGSQGNLNDLWKYEGGQWTWVSGGSAGELFGVCGTKGSGDAANTPGSRVGSSAWTDPTGNLWLFGGVGRISLPAMGSIYGLLNDLWKFDGAQWTWISGDANASDLPGIYGTKGTPSPANLPGGRTQTASAVDSSGRLWLFGGYGREGANYGNLNDLWRLDP